MNLKNDKKFLSEDLIFFSDNEQSEEELNNDTWKVLVVDDDLDVHRITKLILDEFEFEGKSLTIYNAYSEIDARKIMNENNDIALIILDVVMKEQDSGLKFIRYVREEICNEYVRIILRTGQPGEAPEKDVIINYDINDYKLKTELTANKLFMSVLTALRSYRDLMKIEANKNGLEIMNLMLGELFKTQHFRKLVSNILTMINDFFNKLNSSSTSSFEATKKDRGFIIEAALGEYEKFVGKKVNEVFKNEILSLIDESVKNNKILFNEDSFTSHFKSSLGEENIIHIKSSKDIKVLEKNLTEIFCANIAMAFDNYYLKEEIDTNQKEIIYTLGEIAEFKMKETSYHVKRVAEYSKLIAKEYGISEEESEIISIASTMHDVGKLMVSESILNKPGRLTKEEFEHVKTHTTAGYNMLKSSKGKVIKVASIIALQHHEKYNGKGYPGGLKGEDIDINARIVAIADVFDALASKRVYKDAWQINKIIELFKSEKNEHFDPDLVDIFLENINRIIEIKNTFADINDEHIEYKEVVKGELIKNISD